MSDSEEEGVVEKIKHSRTTTYQLKSFYEQCH